MNNRGSRRSLIFNMHKVRYWLSVGAQPTLGVQRLLHRFDLWPRPLVTHGSASLYERPEKKVLGVKQTRSAFNKFRNQRDHYRNLLARHFALVE